MRYTLWQVLVFTIFTLGVPAVANRDNLYTLLWAPMRLDFSTERINASCASELCRSLSILNATCTKERLVYTANGTVAWVWDCTVKVKIANATCVAITQVFAAGISCKEEVPGSYWVIAESCHLKFEVPDVLVCGIDVGHVPDTISYYVSHALGLTVIAWALIVVWDNVPTGMRYLRRRFLPQPLPPIENDSDSYSTSDSESDRE